jgi:hypothetical protein
MHLLYVRFLKFTKFFALGKEEGTPLRLLLDFLGTGRAENWFLNPYSIEKVS